MAVQIARASILRACRCIRNAPSLSRASVCAPTICQRWQQQHRLQSTEVIPQAHIEGQEKDYPPHICSIVDQISQLTLLEVADLNELLKKTLKISDAPVMAMGAMQAGAGASGQEEEEEAPAKVEQTLFTVKLTKFDNAKKVALIKEIKKLIEGMNLVQAKKFVESAPTEVKTDISKEEAEQLKKAIEAVGGTAEIE